MTSLVFIIGFSLSEFVLSDNTFDIRFSYYLAGASLVSLVFGILGIFWQPKKMPMLLTTISYITISTAISIFIMESNNKSGSYNFIMLWAVVAIFVAAFGAWAYVLAIFAFGSLVAFQYLSGQLGPDTIIFDILAGPLPMIISFFLWRVKTDKSSEDKALKNLASELSQVANQSEIIINAIGDGVLAIDRSGTVALINPAAQTITGWTKEDAVSLNYKSILQLVDNQGNAIPLEKSPVQAVLNNNQQVIDNELTLVTKSGKKINVSLLVSPIGEVGSGVIAVFRDITKQKAEESEQAEFISTASHEMRTPVASIEGYLGLALNPQTATLDEKGRIFVTKAHEAAQHLGRLFQDLLDITKADDQKLPNYPKVVDIMQLVDDIVVGLQPKAKEKNLDLIFKPQPSDSERYVAPVYYVNLDNDHIREIVGNLIENAIKYTEKGSIMVDLSATDEIVSISVKDTGIGIPSEDQPHLFQKFYRVNNAETNQIGGTGLGLYLSKKLAELLGGKIRVESEYHKGSTFYVDLPRISNEEAKSLKQEQARQVSMPKPTEGLLQDVLPPRPTSAPAPQPTTGSSSSLSAKPATEVPRGEALTEAQKAQQIAKLKELARQQGLQNPAQPDSIAPESAKAPNPRQLVGQPVLPPRAPSIRVPSRAN